MKIYWMFIVFLGVGQSTLISDLIKTEWETFKLKFHKKYANKTEERYRFKVYMANRLTIAEHNLKYVKGQVSFAMNINQFGDLLHKEYVHKLHNGDLKLERNMMEVDLPTTNLSMPKSLNWVDKGAVTGVKDQEHCDSGYAFSVTGALEGQHFIKLKKLVSLSEQNLLDCTRRYGNHGCGGGRTDRSFQYIKDNGGIDTEHRYPYQGQEDDCRYKHKDDGATVKGFAKVRHGDEHKLKEAVSSIGPISVTIDGRHNSFQFYSGGIYSDAECSSTHIHHAALVVGYGTDLETDDDYWIVKNSFGSHWGEKGYIKMRRNKQNQCGIATNAVYPLV